IGASSSNAGSLGVESGGTLSIIGNLTNSGTLFNEGFGTATTFTVSGTLTNNSGGFFQVGDGSTADVANVATLVNNGNVTVNNGATLNLTSQANGITDVVSGSNLTVVGTFKAGANNALAKLNSIEGALNLENGQSTTATPGSGTLTVSSGGALEVFNGASAGTTLTVSGNLTNSGSVNAGGQFF